MAGVLQMYVRKLRRLLGALFLPFLSWFPVAFVGFRTLTALAPTGDTTSTSNDLLFRLAPADSPLRAYDVPLTAGVVPKRFHSHNDCASARRI
jgi:hypothetical protein